MESNSSACLDPFTQLTLSNKTTSRLLALPPELRNQVYELCIPELNVTTINISPDGNIANPLALIKTCHQLGSEVTPIILQYAARKSIMLVFRIHDLDFSYAIAFIESLNKQAKLALVQTAAICFRCTLSAAAVPVLEARLTEWLRFCVRTGLFMNKDQSYGKTPTYSFEGNVCDFGHHWVKRMTEVAQNMHDRTNTRTWQLCLTLPKQELRRILMARGEREKASKVETWENNWAALPQTQKDAFTRLQEDKRQKGKQLDVSRKKLEEALNVLEQLEAQRDALGTAPPGGEDEVAAGAIEQQVRGQEQMFEELKKVSSGNREAYEDADARVRKRREGIMRGDVEEKDDDEGVAVKHSRRARGSYDGNSVATTSSERRVRG